tara:strand:- start:1204 stop:1974 length:771 start_codon:yes stop_codon:yes gene_type:complete
MKKLVLFFIICSFLSCNEDADDNLEIIHNHNSFASSPDGSYINIPDSQYLNINDRISIVFWTKLNSLGPTDPGGNGYNHFVNKWNGTNHQYVVANNNQGLYAYFNDTNNTNYGVSINHPQIGKWEFVAVTYNQGEAKIFLNSELIHEFSLSHSPLNISRDINIGGAASSLGDLESLDGLMDDVQIWSKTLSQAEIEILMNNSPTGNENDLVGYWNFEEDSINSSSVNDATVFGNNGTMKDTDNNTINIVLSPDTPY